MTALAAMEPTPITDTAFRAMRGPNTASSRKLKNGIAGIRPVSSSTLSPHLAGAVGVEHSVLVVQAQKQRQPNGNLRRRHCQNKKEHGLAIGLHPMRAGGNKGQAGG